MSYSHRHSLEVEPREAVLYGTAEVYANRKTRRSNMGFEVLPAGVLGPRQELLSYDADESNVDTDATVQRSEGAVEAAEEVPQLEGLHGMESTLGSATI
ncbi:hypothetical protein ACCO45_000978 [Purpureocillium lilacinum]|uniref:Uncharacterized protein n=1 Tax=Purpureocillium lilacinum TaxID=33203 RepID=A0ACC4E8B9_PURLI